MTGDDDTGKPAPEALEAAIARWSAGSRSMPLSEYLGWSTDEYDRFCGGGPAPDRPLRVHRDS